MGLSVLAATDSKSCAEKRALRGGFSGCGEGVAEVEAGAGAGEGPEAREGPEAGRAGVVLSTMAITFKFQGRESM